jgi:hypothetical protein
MRNVRESRAYRLSTNPNIHGRLQAFLLEGSRGYLSLLQSHTAHLAIMTRNEMVIFARLYSSR